MKERFAEVRTPEGVMRAFVTHPEEGGPFPAVVFFMDVWGLREELYEIARRVATVGYYAVIPDFYHRQGPALSFDFRNAENQVISVARLPDRDRSAVEGALAKLSNAMVIDDVAALLDFLSRQTQVRPGGKGAIGYCMGGRHAFCAATRFPDDFVATASLHGTALVSEKPDSPHRLIARLQGEVYCGFGEKDVHTPPALVAEIAKLMEKSAARYRYEVHPGADHGYALPNRDVYDSRAAARDWELIFAMFQRRIPVQRQPHPA